MALPPVPDHPCLLLDVDGSLIDIAPRPEGVVVPDTLRHDLSRLDHALGGAVALISGRSIAQLDALFAPLRLRASGVHGAEIRFEPDAEPVLAPGAAIAQPVRRDLANVLARFPGTFVEDKRFSLAVHYRAVPTVGDALSAALTSLIGRHEAAGIVLMPGHFVFEIKRPTFDKGVAVRQFLGHPRFHNRTPVFIGDDVTDRPGFSAAIEAGGVAYAVGQEIAGTSGTFASPSHVRAWMTALANQESMAA